MNTPEPVGRLFNQGYIQQGYIQAHAYQDDRGMYVEAAEVEELDGEYVHDGKPVTRSLGKMGKSLKNAVSPTRCPSRTDATPCASTEMYMGPLDSKRWEPRDIVGMHQRADRRRRAVARRAPRGAPGHQGVTDSMKQLKFNTAIAALIDLNGEMLRWPSVPRASAEVFVLMLAPLAPHLAEELWWRLGHRAS